MPGHTPLPDAVSSTPPQPKAVESPVRRHLMNWQATVPIRAKDFPAIHSTILSTFQTSKRRTARDNLPIGVKANGRDTLAVLFAKLGYTVGAEIGVKKGLFSKVLLDANPKLRLFCVDTWGIENDGYAGRHSRNFRHAKALLAGCNVTFIQKTSSDALADFADESLDFVYIDANHTFDYCCPDIIFWSKKVKSGGIVGCHDYFNHLSGGVVKAVDAYVHCHHIDPWYVTEEVFPTAFWVKP